MNNRNQSGNQGEGRPENHSENHDTNSGSLKSSIREAKLFVATKKRGKTPPTSFGNETMDITADLRGTKRKTREHHLQVRLCARKVDVWHEWSDSLKGANYQISRGFTTAKIRKPPEQPSIDDWIKKRRYDGILCSNGKGKSYRCRQHGWTWRALR